MVGERMSGKDYWGKSPCLLSQNVFTEKIFLNRNTWLYHSCVELVCRIQMLHEQDVGKWPKASSGS
jgi:hypothetical protein